LKNFNVKISMKFSRQENFMKFTITATGTDVLGDQKSVLEIIEVPPWLTVTGSVTKGRFRCD